MQNNKYIIDVHQHLWCCQGKKYKTNTLDVLLETNQKNNIKESWLSGVRLQDGTGDSAVEEAFLKYPNQIRGMGFIVPGRDNAAKVREFKDRGFFGLKIIYPQNAYDDPVNNEIWEEAIKQKMPVTFHTGSLINFPPYPFHIRHMNPDKLFQIAGRFPELIIMVAHMGNTYFQDACILARNENIFLDCSGGGSLKKMPKSYFDNTIYWKEVQHKIAYGVDQLFEGIASEIEHTAKFAENVNLSKENLELMWHGNAEKIIQKCL
jgi:predicted TIM-barrel fold metal-dependent hydrolase